ncbi:MAG: phosphotransferase [Pseudomonadota bacterium]
MILDLFAADKFASADPVVTPLPPSMADRLRRLAESHWPGTEAATVEAVGDVVAEETAANSHNFRLCGASGAFVLKRVTRPDLLPVIARQMKLMAHCADRGAAIPRPRVTAGGELVVEEDGQWWCLLDFADGRYFQGRPDEIVPAGTAIGRLHSLLANVPLGLIPERVRPPYFTDEEHDGFGALVSCRPRWPEVFGVTAAAVLDGHWHVVADAWSRLSREPRLRSKPAVPVHFDLHPHNLLVRDGQCLILDFDSVVRAPAAMAVGFAMVKLMKRVEAARRREGATSPMPAEAALRFREAVAAQWSAVAEPADLELFARAEVLRRFLSVCRFILAGRAIVWNGPLVHLAALVEADLIFASPVG